jgi:serine/threonine-protein kinase
VSTTETQSGGVQLLTLRNLVGHTISGAYRIDGVIGEGGMGIVFDANQLKLDRMVALKVLKLDGPNAQEAFARFEREIAILSNLSHPNIVRVLDSGHDPELDLYFIAMDRVSGEPLADLTDGYRLAPALALDIVYQIAGALAQPHSEGVIHRDLKPDNVLLEVVADETLQVRLVDFGIARAFSADKKLTATGVVVGTPHYMAPELVREKELDRRTDIYALGVMLHELLTGTLPFDGGNFMQIGFKHVQSPIPTLASKVDGFDMPDLEQLLATMMAKEKEDRFESVAELRRAIEQVIDNNGFPRVRVDPNLPPAEAIEHLRVPVDSQGGHPDSAEWLPPSGPQPATGDLPRDAGEHTPLTTTSIEGTPKSNIVPIVVAIVAVVVALVAVVLAMQAANSSNEPLELEPDPAAGQVAGEVDESDPSTAGPAGEQGESGEDALANVLDGTDTDAGVSADAAVAKAEPTGDETGTEDAEKVERAYPDPTAKSGTLRPSNKATSKPSSSSKTEAKTKATPDAETTPKTDETFEKGMEWATGADD